MTDDESAETGAITDPEKVVDAAAVDSKDPTPPAASRKPSYPFPRRTLEDALRIPTALRTHNGGNEWPPSEIAKAISSGARTPNYFYLTAASRDYGLTEGTRDAQVIKLTDLGRLAVYPSSDEELGQAKLKAFLNIEKFRQVAEHYHGSALPDGEFVRNTLETRFLLDPRVHDEFLEVFDKNCRFVGIGAEWDGSTSSITSTQRVGNGQVSVEVPRSAVIPGTPVAPLGDGERPVCFVIMPFVEKTDKYNPGFFKEVFASLFKPAIEAAGFEARTALRQGSDVIHATIVNELLDAHLVLCDLTEHNPNVLFELGLRMADGKPIALVKAAGTNPIFDVDHMLRVESYDPNLWPSTVVKDVPKLKAHIQEAWSPREAGRSWMAILRQVAVPVGT